MEGLSAIQTNHLRHLKSFVEAQSKFYANCHQLMQDLNRELRDTEVLSQGETSMPILRPGIAAPKPEEPPSYSYAAQPGKSPTNEANADLSSSETTNGGGPEMHQVSLASPPPMPSNLRNADFFWKSKSDPPIHTFARRLNFKTRQLIVDFNQQITIPCTFCFSFWIAYYCFKHFRNI